ncbi:unnamed protein product [Haemonchus placei]|uniref:Uncharacterized protein n=1 Tax=Haemonchus placei TaxID=6290 RepID=A0A3P7W4Y0_HAEPC|nr:unnamed protein product [Haemonchus placei]
MPLIACRIRIFSCSCIFLWEALAASRSWSADSSRTTSCKLARASFVSKC